MTQHTFLIVSRNVDQYFKEGRKKQRTTQTLWGILTNQNQVQNLNIDLHLLKKSTMKSNSKHIH